MKTLHNALALIRELKTEEIEIISGGIYEGSGPSTVQMTFTTCTYTVQTPQGSTTATVIDDATPTVIVD